MHKDMIRGLYIAATNYCEQEGRNEAWLFENKFAELIVKECAAVARNASNDLTNMMPVDVMIAQHFGLEE